MTMNETNDSLTPKYYDLDFQVTTVVLFGTLAVVGIFGNIMVVAVVLTVRGMMSPTNCYLVSLAVADSLFFLSSMPVEISYMIMPRDVYIFGKFGCPILTFLPYLAINSSSLSIAAFTVERYIAICHPMKAQYICTIKRAKIIIIGVWCFSLLYNSAWLYLVKVKPLTNPVGQVTCTFTLNRQNYKFIYLTDIFLFYFFPLILYFALYGRMACILFRANFVSENNKAVKSPVGKIGKQQYANECTTIANGHGSASEQLLASTVPLDIEASKRRKKSYHCDSKAIGSSANKSRVQVVKMLIVIVCLFALCWLPYRGLVVFNSFATKKWMNQWYLLFAKTMITVNCAINPILYNLMSAKFRRSFKLMFVQLGLTCSYRRLYSSSFGSSYPSQRPRTSSASIRRPSVKRAKPVFCNKAEKNKIKNLNNKLEIVTSFASPRRKSAV